MLFQISGRLFSDSGPRRSSRLSVEASVNANANTTVVSGNGTSNSNKGGSKLSPMAFRSMAVRKGQLWANENIDEGDDSRYISLLYCINLFWYMEMRALKSFDTVLIKLFIQLRNLLLQFMILYIFFQVSCIIYNNSLKILSKG